MKETVGIGILGTGFARKVQIPAFAACSEARIVSVASGSLANAEATASEFGIPHFTADWRETVTHSGVDLVCMTTPPNLHREMALFTLENKKHLLAEKPMAMNVDEAEEMTAAARAAGVLALIDHELRFQPGRQKAKALLQAGEIGMVRHAKYSFRAPHRGDPAVAWNWWSDIEQGGGTLGAINSHVIDSLQWFLSTNVSRVSCQLQTHVKERRDADGNMRQVTTDDEANMLLRFAAGPITEDATGLASVSMIEQPAYLNRVEFYGADGAMRVDHRGELYIAKNGETNWTLIDIYLGTTLPGVPDTGFARGFRFFAPEIVRAVAEGRTTIGDAATFEDGLSVQRVLDAARESDASGRHVDLKGAR